MCKRSAADNIMYLTSDCFFNTAVWEAIKIMSMNIEYLTVDLRVCPIVSLYIIDVVECLQTLQTWSACHELQNGCFGRNELRRWREAPWRPKQRRREGKGERG